MIEMEPTPAMTIERARPEDAEAMVAVQAQTWMATYPNEAAGISKAAIRRRIYGEHNEKIGPRIERYRQRISHPDDTHAEFVARSNGQVVGFVHAGLDSKQRRQIQALYVLPHTQGKGVGSGLLRAALDWHATTTSISRSPPTTSAPLRSTVNTASLKRVSRSKTRSPNLVTSNCPSLR